MAISIKEYNERVNKFLIALPDELRDINKSIAMAAIPDIKKRLIDKGQTGEGKSLGKYSERPISPGLLIGKGLGSGADKKIEDYLKQQKKLNPNEPIGISYKKFRELNNRPTDHVTLSFSGETLNDLAVIQDVITGGLLVTTIGSKNSKTKDVTNKEGRKTGTVGTGDVLDQLGEKYGDILSLTEAEENEYKETFDEMVQDLIDQYL
jgi:hypothetical protein